MLAAIGAKSIDDLFVDVPERASGRACGPARVAGELEVERALSAMAAKNATAGAVPFFCGAGAYKHHVPATVDHVIQRSEFLTSYTPISRKSRRARCNICTSSRPRSRT